MRVALLLLIAANLLAFAWGQGWLAPIIGDVRQPERMDRQVGPDRLRVLGTGDRARTERAVAGRVEADDTAGRTPGPAAGGAQPGSPGAERAPNAGPAADTEPAAATEPAAGADTASRTDAPRADAPSADAARDGSRLGSASSPAAGASRRTHNEAPDANGVGAGSLDDAPGASVTGRSDARARDGAGNASASAGADDIGLREMASRVDERPAAGASSLATRSGARVATPAPASSAGEAVPDIADAPTAPVAQAARATQATQATQAAQPGPAPDAAPAGTAETAPAVPFGLAEPPITAALANDSTQRMAANALASTDAVPDALPGPEAKPARTAPERATTGAAVPGNLETGSWPASPASDARAAMATQACFDLRGLDAVRAEAAREQLEGIGAASIEEVGVGNRSGYIVYLPAFETVELAQARIAQLREQGVRDIYLVLDGTYRLAISLGVFNRMDSVELLLGELRARGVEDAQVGYVNPAATRMTLRVRGPEDLLDEAQVRAIANLRGGQLARCP